jgi:hypothetical protein
MFLRALLASAGKGAFFMEQLLMRAQPAALIAFLSGRVTFTQALSVWFSAPKFEMIRALLRV